MTSCWTWNPQSDVAKPYRRPAEAESEDRNDREPAPESGHALIYIFGRLRAPGPARLMIVLRHPMQVAMAPDLGDGVPGRRLRLLGVHFIAAFQVLIYVRRVMVSWSTWIHAARRARPVVQAALLALPRCRGSSRQSCSSSARLRLRAGSTDGQDHGLFGCRQFAVAFLNEYWLHFELTSVPAGRRVVAAMAVIQGASRQWISCSSFSSSRSRCSRWAPRGDRPPQTCSSC